MATLGIVALLAGLVSAQAAPKKKANLVVSKVGNAPAQVQPGDAFDVNGKVRNKGTKGARARVVLSLRETKQAKPGPHVLGSDRIGRVAPGKRKNFTVPATVPESLGGPYDEYAEPGTYYMVACVRARGNKGPQRCKVARRTVIVNPLNYSAGARSLGDELFPQIGNGGYDAEHYDIDLRYDPATNVFETGTKTTMTATATQNLSQFSLDFQDIPVSSVTVDGATATYQQVLATPDFPGEDPDVTQPRKLVVNPPGGIREGEEFTVVVEYAGTPVRVIDADGSSEGWIPACHTHTGPEVCDGAIVVNEPIGAQGWFPSNNFPTDKATFTTRITVPDGKTAFGVGELVSNTVDDGKRTWVWAEDDPTSTYLTTATNGDFQYSEDSITETLTGRTFPHYVGIDSSATGAQTTAINTALARTEEMTNYLSERYGPYPFDSNGAVADAAAGVCYALEVQTKSHYAGNCATGAPSVSQSTLLHEISHQWFGNAVTLEHWNDIWFNEGWAQWSSWSWNFADGTSPNTTAQQFATNYASGPATKWDTIPTELNNDPADLFSTFPTYTRGAMTLEGYRQIVGNTTFFEFARELQTRFAYDNISTEEFVEVALEMSGLEGEQLDLLEEYFQQWLYEAGRPALTPNDFT